jgi:hypothetical protein
MADDDSTLGFEGRQGEVPVLVSCPTCGRALRVMVHSRR